MRNKFLNTLFIGLVLSVTSITASAGIIAATDFDGRTVSGNTASNLAWALNGVSEPGNLSADFDLFNSANSQDKFAVNRNIGNEGSWSVDIALNVLSTNNIALSSVTLDAYIFSNRGALQNSPRNLNFVASLFDSSDTLLKQVNLLDIYTDGNNFESTKPNGSTVSLNFDGFFLSASNNYKLTLTANDGAGMGNNAGFDNLIINGELTSVPEPTTLAIFALGIFGLVSRKINK